MRKKLKQIGNQERHTYQAEYGGVGFKRSYKNHFLPTLLLKNVRLNNDLVTDHLWINYTKGFSKLGRLQDDDVIVFDGRVTSYVKGYFTEVHHREYGLERPSKIHLLNKRKTELMPDALKNKNALVGYVMKVNKKFYVTHNRPFDQWYVNQYQSWCDKHHVKN